MGKRIKVTITGYYEPDLDGAGYKNVEFDGETRDLATVEEAAQYDEQNLSDDNMSLDELLDGLEDTTTKFEVEPDPLTAPVTDGHAPSPRAGVDNPFTDADESKTGGSFEPSPEVTGKDDPSRRDSFNPFG
jgi:hypothetical protein